MFYPDKLVSIQPQDRVLEIGPGATPHPRSNAFLELAFDTPDEKILQRGGKQQDAVLGARPIYFYDGSRFPFETAQFDYVICSHVIEHVPTPEIFISEMFRVAGGRGYIEYPLITYEYLYDFKVHLNFVKFDFECRTLNYLPKEKTGFREFSDVSLFFNRMLENGWDDLCSANKALFFEGFEFTQPFSVKESDSIPCLLPPRSAIPSKAIIRKLLGRIMNVAGL